MRTKEGHYAKGHTGNEKGRPVGTRNKATLAALSLLEGETEALTRKVIEMALEGDTAALRLCLERIAPPAKERPIEGFTLPDLQGTQGVLNALNEVAKQLSSGQLLPNEAKAICHLLDKYHQHFEIIELAKRLETLEAVLAGRRPK